MWKDIEASWNLFGEQILRRYWVSWERTVIEGRVKLWHQWNVVSFLCSGEIKLDVIVVI